MPISLKDLPKLQAQEIIGADSKIIGRVFLDSVETTQDRDRLKTVSIKATQLERVPCAACDGKGWTLPKGKCMGEKCQTCGGKGQLELSSTITQAQTVADLIMPSPKVEVGEASEGSAAIDDIAPACNCAGQPHSDDCALYQHLEARLAKRKADREKSEAMQKQEKLRAESLKAFTKGQLSTPYAEPAKPIRKYRKE